MANSVLVTGGAGYIVSHACKALAAAGYTPVTLDNLVCGHRAALRWGPFVAGDVGDPPKLVAASANASAVLGWVPRHSDPSNVISTAWAWEARVARR